jgi:hypothetical protein
MTGKSAGITSFYIEAVSKPFTGINYLMNYKAKNVLTIVVLLKVPTDYFLDLKVYSNIW